VDEVSFRFRPPQRGEVVVFRFPRRTSEFYIKRLIGLPGETVEIAGGKVRIYNDQFPAGFSLEENYLGPTARTEGFLRVTLGKDEYFVLGDNRQASYDSRRWGVLPREDIIGRVWLRPWPIPEATIFAAPNY